MPFGLSCYILWVQYPLGLSLDCLALFLDGIFLRLGAINCTILYTHWRTLGSTTKKALFPTKHLLVVREWKERERIRYSVRECKEREWISYGGEGVERKRMDKLWWGGSGKRKNKIRCEGMEKIGCEGVERKRMDKLRCGGSVKRKNGQDTIAGSGKKENG